MVRNRVFSSLREIKFKKFKKEKPITKPRENHDHTKK